MKGISPKGVKMFAKSLHLRYKSIFKGGGMKGYSEAIEPTYSNGAQVATSTSEFTFDFWWTSPDSDQPTTVARIILSPPIAKRFAKLLQESIQIYEDVAGEIQVKGPEKPRIGYLK